MPKKDKTTKLNAGTWNVGPVSVQWILIVKCVLANNF